MGVISAKLKKSVGSRMRSSVMGGEKNYYVTALAGNFFNLILLCQRVRSLGSLSALISNSRAELKGLLKMMAHFSSDRLLLKSCESIWDGASWAFAPRSRANPI
jgi:hypothetical protein